MSDSLGSASLHFARLYDHGRYPGADISDGEQEIAHGEVVLLADPDAAIAWLDPYERYVHGVGDRNEYDRHVNQMRLAGGETFHAWRRSPCSRSSRIASAAHRQRPSIER